jgi:hypothetical protein
MHVSQNWRRALVIRLCALTTSAVALAGLVVSAAAANTHADRYLNTTYAEGSRATIDNPSSGEMSVSNGDMHLTSAMANDGTGSHLIQQGVEYEYNAPESPDCNQGVGGPVLYYFVEIQLDTTTYKCYGELYAAGGDSHRHAVRFSPTDGLWHAYFDGADQSITTGWTPCNLRACGISAFSENSNNKPGAWHGKFAGSGNTAWGMVSYNGTLWTDITSSLTFVSPNSGWTGPFGPFPAGIWSFIFSA